MGHLLCSAVLGLLFLQLTYSAKPVFDAGHQWVYEYNSNILIKNALSDEHIAEWNVTGKLKIQSSENQAIMKLDNLKTRVFNGIRTNRKDAVNHNIPDEAQVLSEAFVVHYSNDDGSHKDIHISHHPDEPLWSINMKRAIASIFQMKEDGQVDKEHKIYEASIYGTCQVAYNVKTMKNKRIIDKKFDYQTCKDVADMDWGNVKSYGSHLAIQGEMNRIYHYTKKNGQFVIGDVESSANYTYRNMPSVRSSQHILQKQIFKLLEQTNIIESIDVSKNTNRRTVLFEYPAETDESFGRNPKEKKDQSELIEEFIPKFEEFKNKFENDTIDQMYTMVSELDKDSLISLTKRIITGDYEENLLMQQIFLSILPYVGEDWTVKLIADLADVDNYNVNKVFLVQLLATFPTYAIPSAKLVKEMEILMTTTGHSQTVKSTALLSFATLVAMNHEKGTISNEILMEYQTKYMELFRSKPKYTDRLTYLLGLINLATGDGKLTVDYIIPIACDTNESKHLRVLAMHSFARLTFSEKKEGEFYEAFWPIVRNKTEAFDVRVAALEMILSNLVLISKKHFNNIIESYDEYQNDPQDRHIQNYIYTKHITLKDEPYYKKFMNDDTTIKMKSMKKHKSLLTWPTGNYYMEYTDEANNFGASLHTKLVANPISNAVNFAEFSYHGNAMSLDLGTYIIYLKFEGPMETIFGRYYADSRVNGYEAIVELMELITKHGYMLKDPDLHMELSVFIDNRAIFALHIENRPYINDLVIDDLKRLIAFGYASVSWPISNINYVISDLGTPIQIFNEVLVVTSAHKNDTSEDSTDEFKSFNYIYRNLWRNSMTLNSYNPIADIDITTYKVINNEKQMQLPIRVHKNNYIYIWKPKKDMLGLVSDHLIGTYADEEIEHYCANCDFYNEIPMGEVENLDVAFLPIEVATGLTFNVNRSSGELLNNEADKLKTELVGLFNDHRTNPDVFLLARPFLYCGHYVNYLIWLTNDVHRLSIRSLPYYNEPTENTLYFNMTEYIFYQNDPFEKVQFDISLALTSKKIANAEQISYFKTNYQFVSKSIINEETAKSHIVNKHVVQVEFTGEETFKICVDRKISYPDSRVNKYSIVPIEPVTGNTKISWGTSNQNSNNCSMETYIKIYEKYSATDAHNQYVRNTKDYETCKQESIGLKYTPPTEACLAAFDMMSEYDLYTFYADFSHTGPFAQAVADIEHTKHGIKLLEIERHPDDNVNFTYSKDFFKLFIDVDKHNIVNNEKISNSLKSFAVNPSDESYDDHLNKYGISNNCFITPNIIKTFNGISIENYEAEVGREFVAVVECTSNARAGLTVQKLSDKKLGFTLISDGNTLTASVVDGKLKVIFNGKDIKKGNTNDPEVQPRTFFLDDNTIYVIDNVLELYYNTEYLLIKTFSLYNSFICGGCTFQEN